MLQESLLQGAASIPLDCYRVLQAYFLTVTGCCKNDCYRVLQAYFLTVMLQGAASILLDYYRMLQVYFLTITGCCKNACYRVLQECLLYCMFKFPELADVHGALLLNLFILAKEGLQRVYLKLITLYNLAVLLLWQAFLKGKWSRDFIGTYFIWSKKSTWAPWKGKTY